MSDSLQTNPHAETPMRRSWHAVLLMVPLLTVLYLPTLFLVEPLSDSSGGLADLAYAMMTIVVYLAAVVVVIPAVAFTMGRWIDGKTREWPKGKAALVFAVVAGAAGLIPAVPALQDGVYGLLPLLSFVFAPMVAAWCTRMWLESMARSQALYRTALGFSIAVAAGILGIGVSVLVANLT